MYFSFQGAYNTYLFLLKVRWTFHIKFCLELTFLVYCTFLYIWLYFTFKIVVLESYNTVLRHCCIVSNLSRLITKNSTAKRYILQMVIRELKEKQRLVHYTWHVQTCWHNVSYQYEWYCIKSLYQNQGWNTSGNSCVDQIRTQQPYRHLHITTNVLLDCGLYVSLWSTFFILINFPIHAYYVVTLMTCYLLENGNKNIHTYTWRRRLRIRNIH